MIKVLTVCYTFINGSIFCFLMSDCSMADTISRNALLKELLAKNSANRAAAVAAAAAVASGHTTPLSEHSEVNGISV